MRWGSMTCPAVYRGSSYISLAQLQQFLEHKITKLHQNDNYMQVTVTNSQIPAVQVNEGSPHEVVWRIYVL